MKKLLSVLFCLTTIGLVLTRASVHVPEEDLKLLPYPTGEFVTPEQMRTVADNRASSLWGDV